MDQFFSPPDLKSPNAIFSTLKPILASVYTEINNYNYPIPKNEIEKSIKALITAGYTNYKNSGLAGAIDMSMEINSILPLIREAKFNEALYVCSIRTEALDEQAPANFNVANAIEDVLNFFDNEADASGMDRSNPKISLQIGELKAELSKVISSMVKSLKKHDQDPSVFIDHLKNGIYERIGKNDIHRVIDFVRHLDISKFNDRFNSFDELERVNEALMNDEDTNPFIEELQDGKRFMDIERKDGIPEEEISMGAEEAMDNKISSLNSVIKIAGAEDGDLFNKEELARLKKELFRELSGMIDSYIASADEVSPEVDKELQEAVTLMHELIDRETKIYEGSPDKFESLFEPAITAVVEWGFKFYPNLKKFIMKLKDIIAEQDDYFREVNMPWEERQEIMLRFLNKMKELEESDKKVENKEDSDKNLNIKKEAKYFDHFKQYDKVGSTWSLDKDNKKIIRKVSDKETINKAIERHGLWMYDVGDAVLFDGASGVIPARVSNLLDNRTYQITTTLGNFVVDEKQLYVSGAELQ